jgi:hypothetical protein
MKKKLPLSVFLVLLFLAGTVAFAAGQEDLLEAAPLNPDFVDWQNREAAPLALKAQ